jgi:putative ABC transport system permease protein
VILAYHDVRRRPLRFLGTAVGVGLLVTVVLAMAGIYAGMVKEATAVVDAMNADLWVVQGGTRGPFADASRLDPSVEGRVAAVAGVSSAERYTFQLLQRRLGARDLRFALVGLAWPDGRGNEVGIVAGRPLAQAHGEMIADASLGFAVGTRLELAEEEYRVVGLTRSAVSSGGEPIAFVTIADAQRIALYAPADAEISERERRLERLRDTDLGRAQPQLEDLAVDPTWQPPAVPPPQVNAILVRVSHRARLAEVARHLAAWPDVTTYTTAGQKQLLLEGVVKKARMQIGLFSVILSLTAAVILAMVIYTMTIEKTHDLAMLRLMGAPARRLAAMVVEEAWLLGAVAYLLAIGIGDLAFPHFPRRIIITSTIQWLGPIAVALIATVGSGLGVVHASRVDPGKVLEG